MPATLEELDESTGRGGDDELDDDAAVETSEADEDEEDEDEDDDEDEEEDEEADEDEDADDEDEDDDETKTRTRTRRTRPTIADCRPRGRPVRSAPPSETTCPPVTWLSSAPSAGLPASTPFSVRCPHAAGRDRGHRPHPIGWRRAATGPRTAQLPAGGWRRGRRRPRTREGLRRARRPALLIGEGGTPRRPWSARTGSSPSSRLHPVVGVHPLGRARRRRLRAAAQSSAAAGSPSSRIPTMRKCPACRWRRCD